MGYIQEVVLHPPLEAASTSGGRSNRRTGKLCAANFGGFHT